MPTIKSFKMFGGKVKCVMVGGTSSGVTCLGLLNSGVRPFPKPNCQGIGDPGGGLQMGRTGRAKGLCLSENPIVPPVPVLRFGKSRTVGGVTCRAVSATIGRGPTMFMCPATTLNNCGSSSRLVIRSSLPSWVTRGSSSSLRVLSHSC